MLFRKMITREKLFKIGIDVSTAPLPATIRRKLRRRWRGRLKIARCRAADYIILSRPSSGRTWLRVMLSRLYQSKYGLPEDVLMEFDNFHRRDRRIPKIAFTHGQGLNDAPDIINAEIWLRHKPIVFLVRHPCDTLVSSFFSNTRRRLMITYKRRLHGHEINQAMFDYVKRELPNIIQFLNTWHHHLESLPNVLMIRYEDMHAEPVATLKTVMAFLEQPFSHDEIAEAVDFASFEKLKQKERDNFFHNKRLVPRDAGDPDSYKVRRAKVGGYRDYFDAGQVAELEAYLQRHLSPRYGYTTT